MKGSTSVCLRKIIRHGFGMLRAFEEWVTWESTPSAAERAAQHGVTPHTPETGLESAADRVDRADRDR